MLRLCLALFLIAAEAGLSPRGEAVLANARAPVEALQSAQAKLPPPRDKAEKLRRLGELDQAVRKARFYSDLSAAPPSEKPLILQALWRDVLEIDARNQAQLLQIAPSEGWFSASEYGRDAARAAFLILQHSNKEILAKFVPRLEPLVRQGELPASEYAILVDHLALVQGKGQVFGTQVRCLNGRWVDEPIDDKLNVNQRRSALGLPPYVEGPLAGPSC